MLINFLRRLGAVLDEPDNNKQRHKDIMAKLSKLGDELAPIVTALSDVGAQLTKATAEIIKAVQTNDPDVPQAVVDKINSLNTIALALKGASQALDDLNPDEPTAPPA